MQALLFTLRTIGIITIVYALCTAPMACETPKRDDGDTSTSQAPAAIKPTTSANAALPVTNVTVTAAEPGCQDTDVDRVLRNVVWRTLNSEVLPDSPEKALALGLLPAVRASTGYAVQDGVDRIVNRFTAYYGAEQRARMFQTLSTGTADERVDVIQRILVADRAATNLLECILRDEGRMQLATSRQPIPLE